MRFASICILLGLASACSKAVSPSVLPPQQTRASEVATVPAAQQGFGVCSFSTTALSFAGTPRQQTLCLLTPVLRYAHLGERLTELPPTLSSILVDVEGVPARAAAEAYLQAEGLTTDAVGGPLSSPVARTQGGLPAVYFVIHDTSTPYFGNAPFPTDLDKNDLTNSFRPYEGKKAAHLFINREGEVRRYHDFNVPWRATKLETDEVGTRSRGRFIHIELIQPRRRDPKGGAKNDAIAPLPGFTQAQYLRLAQAYVAASVRAGRWMIPAFHAVVDDGIRGAHDDPQNFSLAEWDKALGEVLEEMK